jgi:di/tricarboxylate transporter
MFFACSGLVLTLKAIPLYVTSLLVPFFAVVLRVARTVEEPRRRLDAKAAAAYVVSSMWNPLIMLLLGGFTIAAALSKYNIAKRMATFVLSKAGTTPRTVLVTTMFVATFASMWIRTWPPRCCAIPSFRYAPFDVRVNSNNVAHSPKPALGLKHVQGVDNGDRPRF